MRKNDLALTATAALALNYFGMEAMVGGQLTRMPAVIANPLMVPMLLSAGVTFIGIVAVHCLLDRHAHAAPAQ